MSERGDSDLERIMTAAYEGRYLPETEDVLSWLERALPLLMGGLFEKYDLSQRPLAFDDSPWCMLALRLALEHEPGMKPLTMKQGAPVDPSQAVDDFIVVVELEKARMEKKSIRAAAHHLVATKQRFKGRSPDGLRERYYALRKPGPARERLRELIESLKENP